MNALVENVHRHPAFAQDSSEPTVPTTESRIEDGVKEKDDKLIIPQLSETESSSKAFNDCALARGGLRRRNKKKTRTTFSRRKGRKSRKEQSYS